MFVDGLLPSWKEGYVKDLLEKFGEIVKVELASNMPAAKRKDFGFVTFNTHDAAVICAKSINNVELGEGENKVNLINCNLVFHLFFPCYDELLWISG